MSGITLAGLRTALAQGSRAQVIRSLSVSAIANKDYSKIIQMLFTAAIQVDERSLQ